MRAGSPAPAVAVAGAEPTPAKPSPTKRKRSTSDPSLQQQYLPFAPHLREEIGTGYTDAQLAGSRSPRSLVAEKLAELDIHGPSVSVPALQFRGAVRATATDNDRAEGLAKRQKKIPYRDRVKAKPASRARNDGERGEQEEENGDDGAGDDDREDGAAVDAATAIATASKPRRMRSPPPTGGPGRRTAETPQPRTRHTATTSPTSTSSPSPPSSASASSDPSSTSPSSLPSTTADQTTPPSWEDLDPDDDGTGLNGIGFRPTPAMAWQRMQRRKLQVQEWRAREAREARQRRNERRNRADATAMATRETPVALGVVGAGKKDVGFGGQKMDGARRTVRFAS